MANSATTGGYSADMAQSVMLASVEKRFEMSKHCRPLNDSQAIVPAMQLEKQ